MIQVQDSAFNICILHFVFGMDSTFFQYHAVNTQKHKLKVGVVWFPNSSQMFHHIRAYDITTYVAVVSNVYNEA